MLVRPLCRFLAIEQKASTFLTNLEFSLPALNLKERAGGGSAAAWSNGGGAQIDSIRRQQRPARGPFRGGIIGEMRSGEPFGAGASPQ